MLTVVNAVSWPSTRRFGGDPRGRRAVGIQRARPSRRRGWCWTRPSRWARSTAASSARSSSTWAAASTPASTSPTTPTADADGFRRRRARAGPRARRHLRPLSRAATSSPTTAGRTASARRRTARRKLDLAWRALETNQFGTDEFMAWCAGLGVEPMMAVNLGTRGVSEAARAAVSTANCRDGHRAGRTCGVAQRVRRAARHPALVPGQRDGRALADRPQDRRGVRPAGRGDRAAPCAGSTRTSSSSPAELEQLAACRPSASWERDRAGALPTTWSTTSRCTPTTNRRR